MRDYYDHIDQMEEPGEDYEEFEMHTDEPPSQTLEEVYIIREKSGTEKTRLDEPFYQELSRIIEQNSADGNYDPQQLVEMLNYFKECCDHRLQELIELREKNKYSDPYKVVQDIAVITKERDTWHMMYILFKDHITLEKKAEAITVEDEEMALEDNWKANQGKMVQQLMDMDGQIRKQQLLAQWLESNAERNLEQAPSFNLLSHSRWDFTINALSEAERKQEAKRFGARTDYSKIVQEVDPDAPTRQGKNLVEDDEVCKIFV
jgi:hypothetical protein